MFDRFAQLRNATSAAVLRGPGSTLNDLRRAIANGNAPPELLSLVEKIRSRAYTVTDDDLTALKDRYTESQLFEIIVAAALGAAAEQLAAARQALDIA